MIGASTDKYWVDNQGHMHIGPPPMKGPFMAVPISGSFSQTDLQKGMYIVNDGPNAIPVYNSKDATGSPIMTVAPGQTVGQIVDFATGPNGYVVYFTSDQITSNSSLFDKVGSWILGFIPGNPVVNAGAVNFSDLQANVTDAQIQKQQTALGNAAANGTSLSNSIKSAVQGATGTLWGAFFPILLVGGGLWLATHVHWKKGKFEYN